MLWGGTASTPSAICEKTSDTPALATTLAPLGALRSPLHCLHSVTNMVTQKCFNYRVLRCDDENAQIEYI